MARLDVLDLGLDVSYPDALERQNLLHARRVAGEIGDTLLLLEHAPVYTLGRSADASHVLFDAETLARAGIACVETSRGGDVTYHGPGQLVGYPVFSLAAHGLRVVEYVEAVEEVLIRAIACFGVRGGRDARNRGVWVGNDKLAAIGIRVSRQVAMHGFALNVSTQLDDYRGIVACGLQDAGVTSLAWLLGEAPAMDAVKREVVRAAVAVFGFEGVEETHA